ncbi:MAG TPA: hypothetical protein VF889_09195 [Bacteroidota bacterium]
MLKEISRLLAFHVHATDGPVGRVHDILVDEDYWIVRAIVIELSPALGSTRVLASPAMLRIPHWEEKLLPLKILSETASGLPPAPDETPAPGLPDGAVCCRSAFGFRVGTTNGVVGRFRDFLVSDVKWVVRYLLVETGPWLFRRKVMVVPEQVERINSAKGLIELRLRAEEVRQSQRYDRQMTVRPVTLIEQQSPVRGTRPHSAR